MNDFLAISACSTEELTDLLDLSADLKALYKKNKRDLCLAGRILAMLFEKPSLRTRISFEVAMIDLGGSAVYLDGPIGRREPTKDMARVLDRYVHGIMARTFAHETILDLAKFAQVPVINALSDYSHPCQAMADMLTIREHLGKLDGLTLAFIGDGNNVARSLGYAGARLGVKCIIGAPRGYTLDEESITNINALRPGTIEQTHDPAAAVKNADVVYTDTWISMGQEQEKEKRLNDFRGFAVDKSLMDKAPKHAKVMHCLPAYRGYEISDEIAESKNSIIFDQAENRLHFQRALLKKLMAK